MSSRIRILPENLANRIAAGEVVERPAAVVKELVENSIDAGATDILVEIECGGRKLIRVVDNGCGMSREDALLSLERHATSKLVSDADLDGIATLGFRGEALPSIASVSRLTLASRENSNLEGTEIYSEGGRIVSVKAHGMATGTSIEVRGLFFNTPARLKFMRSSVTEAGHVGELLVRLAISRPDIRFTYISDGKSQFRMLQGDLQSRVSTFLGNASLHDTWPVVFSGENISINGLVCGPSLARSNSAGVYTYINGRFIKDKVVHHAIFEAYRGVIDKGRFPVLVLFVEMPFSEVDVNVHPTKHEVRFREQGKVHDCILSAIGNVLSQSPWTKRSDQQSGNKLYTEPRPEARRLSEVQDALARYDLSGTAKLTGFNPGSRAIPTSTGGLFYKNSPPEDDSDIDNKGYYSSLAVIGQYKSMYIVCQDGVDLVLIDQHAAHERIAYQRLRSEHAGGSIESQMLLFPETVELTYSEAAAVREHEARIANLGFEIENFGGTTHVIKAVPRLIASAGYLSAFREILSELEQLSRSVKADQLLDNILARIACHSVIRGNHALSLPEIRALLQQMDTTDFSATCPHGRPVLVKIALPEIEKMFRRSKSGVGE
ncbi:DNA mismatch repair protein MutL [Geobacter sp. OR-1]|uniref:DNA mismatch repair endonuclease MutL n=1 Tax=Geobacter sp. OR-1 TaxID=1266765 RepID=UPI00054195E4|nr:DNA mismatch repair endonuclease MutL [Geobacter sp. OR-1]GAM11591.1 DNA mismatch repair protein MutL [Geobacter sp. OR-1]